MMALHPGGRPGASRRVRLVPVRHSSMDHRAVARIVLALARQMAAEADEAAQSAADEVVSSRTGACSRDERIALVGRCAAEKFVSASAGSGSAGRCAHQRHEGAHYSAHGLLSTTSHAVPDCTGAAESDEDAAVSSTPGGTP